MKKLLFIFLVLFLQSVVMCCSNHPADGRMQAAYRLLNTHPDSSLLLLSSCDSKQKDRANHAYYSLVYTIAQDKSGLDVDNDSLLRYAYNYYRKHPDDSLYAKCLFYMGNYYYLNDSIRQSVDLLTEAHKVAEQQGDLYLQYLALDRLSVAYQLGNPEKSVESSKQAYARFCQYDSTNLYNRVFLLMGIGNSYGKMNEPDSVLLYMNQALKQAQRAKDTTLIGEAYHSLSVGYRRVGKADSALYYAKKACDMVAVRKPSLSMQLAMSYLECDSLNQAEALFKSIAETPTTPNTRYAAYRYLTEIHMLRTKDLEGKHYVDSTLAQLMRIYFDSQHDLSEYRNSNEDLNVRTDQANQNYRNSLLVTCIVFVAAVVVIGLILLSYRNFRNYSETKFMLEKQSEKARIERLELLHKQEIMQKDYEMQAKHKDHEMQIHQLQLEQEKQSILMQSKERQLSFAKSYILAKLDLESLQKKMKCEIRKDESEKDTWFELEIALDEIYGGFSTHFRAKHANLKEDDVHFCMLVKLGLNNAELEHFYCRGLQAIKQRLLNLKPKLGIESSSISAREYIQKFDVSVRIDG